MTTAYLQYYLETAGIHWKHQPYGPCMHTDLLDMAPENTRSAPPRIGLDRQQIKAKKVSQAWPGPLDERDHTASPYPSFPCTKRTLPMTMATATEPKDAVAFASASPRAPLPAADDGHVAFEEHLYYAAVTRAAEAQRAARESGPTTTTTTTTGRTPPGTSSAGSGAGAVVTEAEWAEASRALRTAGWGSVFYLIATDVLGPSQVPYVLFSPSWPFGVPARAAWQSRN